MIIKNFLEERKSVRDFKDKKIDDKTLLMLNDIISEINREIIGKVNVYFSLYRNGEDLFSKLDGVGGYDGVMIEAPAYVIMDVREESDSSTILSAYYFEKLITKISKLGLDTCWITLKNLDKSAMKNIFGEEKFDVQYALAIGYGKSKKFFEVEQYSERIPLTEIVFKDKFKTNADLEDLENMGLGDVFASVRFAPSSFNSQSWRYVLTGKSVELYMEMDESQKEKLADAGIAMYYFEGLVESMGINSKWDLADRVVYVDEKYRYIGKFDI